MSSGIGNINFGSNSQDPFTFGSIDPTNSGSITQDSLSVFESFVSLKDYMTAIGKARVDLDAQLQSNQDSTLDALTQVYFSISQRSQALSAAYNAIATQATLAQQFYAQQLVTEAAIDTYNNNIVVANRAIDILNNALATYNSTVPATTNSTNALATAIGNYNITMNLIATPYNAAQAAYPGQDIGSLNAQRAALGMPPLVPGTMSNTDIIFGSGLPLVGVSTTISPPNEIPLQHVFNANTLPVMNPAPPSVDQAIVAYFPILAQNIISANQAAQQQIAIAKAATLFIDNLNPTDPTMPLAYIQRTAGVLFESPTGTAPAVGVSAIALALGAPSQYLDRTITHSSYQSFYLEATTPVPSPLYDQLHLFIVNLVSQLAGTAGTAPSLQNESSTADTPSATLDRALSFANAVRNLDTTTIASQGLSQLILTDPSLAAFSLTEKQAILNNLTSVIKINLLELATAQISFALGTPGLTAQVLANISGAPSADQLFALSEAQKLNGIIQDPLKQVQIKQTVANGLIAAGYTVDNANALATKALNNVFATGSFNTTLDLLAAVQQELDKQGVAPALTSQLSQSVGTFVNTEIALPFLDRVFQAGVLPDILNVISPQTLTQYAQADVIAGITTAIPGINQLYPPGSLGRVTLDQVLREDLTKPEVVTALRQTFASKPDFIAVRDFRSELVNQLIAQKISSSDATKIANRISQLYAPTVSDNPLLAATPQTILKPVDLIDNVSTFVVDRLTPELGVFTARVKAEQTDRALIANLQQINQELVALRGTGSDAQVTSIYQQIPQIATPTVPLFATNLDVDQRVATTITNYMNPAAQTDIRTADTTKLPIKFQHDIQI